MIELDKIYNEDCLEGMKQIPDGTIDAIICDLPYGTTKNSWDCLIPLDKLWAEYRRITKPNAAIVLFSQQPFTSKLVCSKIELFRHSITWIKDKCSNFIAARYQPEKFTEDIVVFSKANFIHNAKNKAIYNPQMIKVDFPRSVEKEKGCYMGDCASSTQIRDRPSNATKRFFGYKKEDDYTQYPKNYVYYTVPHSAKERFHPTQKPVDLLRYLVLTYTNEGDTVLDNCSGSGTTAVACVKEKRHFICFEKDEIYWKKSVERIWNEQRQLKLF